MKMTSRRYVRTSVEDSFLCVRRHVRHDEGGSICADTDDFSLQWVECRDYKNRLQNIGALSYNA